MMKRFPFYKQLDHMDCGPSCLRMVAKHYGKSYSAATLREKSSISRSGVSLKGISDAAEAIGFKALSASIHFDVLKEKVPLPLIAHWRARHFVTVYDFKKSYVYVADPAHGLIKYSRKEFLEGWLGQDNQGEKGIVLLLEPTPEFYAADDEALDRTSIRFLFNYLKPYRKYVVQLLLGMALGSLLLLVFPFLTQAIVDIGISSQNIGFINLILLAQLMLFFSRTAVESIRNWILLHIGTRVNIAIISDFLRKLMKLPLSFFDTKMVGDIMERINDHKRIEIFLSATTLNVLFSIFNFILFGIILAYYEWKIFAVFAVGSLCYYCWIMLFMKRRRELDFKLFDQLALNRNNLIQLISGMQEIRLHNAEKQKRMEWERIQARMFHVNVQNMTLNQYQQNGGIFINELKNIVITFLAAKSVLSGDITLGMMLAVQYIIGQLNAPLNQLIGFIHSFQDARISLERLSEVHARADEEENIESKVSILPDCKSLTVRGLGFQYEGRNSPYVLKNVDLEIPEGKVTAIVGTSGSGKTTLIKLLLKIYEPTLGTLTLSGLDLKNVKNSVWRDRCGCVLQDGFIFSDTVARNIVINDDEMDRNRLAYAVKVANIREFIESLPLGYQTKIGRDGHGLSQGQKQRILIARAVYKDPEYIFFDEATNALDANNERMIMENLNQFFKGRTVIVVAHRLSTVKDADQILVLEKGKVIETGTHETLVARRGAYFTLVRNQLELGN